jgi:DNA polymerase-3 subunit delta
MANSRTATGAKSGARAQRLDARSVEALLTEAGAADEAICVVSGSEDALRRLIVNRWLARAHGSDATIVRVSACDAGAATAIQHAAAPALFGGATWLVVEELDQAGDEVQAAVKDTLPGAGPDLRVILSHGGGQRGKGVITAAGKVGARVVEARPIATAALPSVLSAHARQQGCTLTSDAARAVIETVGEDVTALLATIDQLVSDADAGQIDTELVRSTFPATSNGNQFEIADLVWHRKAEDALVAFRGLADRNGVGAACVTLVAALSYSLRALTRFVTERPSGSPWQVASALGVSTWKVDTLAAQARLWRPAQLASAAVLLATADADAKGGLGDAGALDPEQKMYAVERLILALGDAA